MSWAARRSRTAVPPIPPTPVAVKYTASKNDTGNAARTVTITSTRGSSISLCNPSLVGSTDSIIKLFVGFGGVKGETKVEVTIEQAQESDGESLKR